MIPKYLDLCAGIGGTRLGLDLAGWNCVYSADIDANAAAVHRLAFGDCDLSDVRKLDSSKLPRHDVLVAGFPCQPFSSSGSRDGFLHSSGNVFEGIKKLISARSPKVVLLENVQGLLSNQNGYSFGRILFSLVNLGYVVEWAVINANWLGVPQNRPRLMIIARKAELIQGRLTVEKSLVSDMLKNCGASKISGEAASLAKILRERNPELGRKRIIPASPFGKAGIATEDGLVNISYHEPQPNLKISIAEICAPNFKYRDQIRSARYWAHTGKTEIYVKEDLFSHCVGTSIGAPPIFCVPLSCVKSKSDRTAALEFANWHSEREGYLLFRIVSERALLLFGREAKGLQAGLKASPIPSTKKYKLVGNLVAPAVAKFIGKHISHWLLTTNSKRSQAKRTAQGEARGSLQAEV